MAQEATEMADLSGPEPGSFCWTEIASSDADKCKSFYSNVFGWNFQDSKVITDGFAYHEFYNGGDQPMGGLYTISREMCGEGELPPPHFLSYVAVDDVDESARLAVELGGSLIKPPDDIPNTGRFAIIQDPTGGMLAMFKMQI